MSRIVETASKATSTFKGRGRLAGAGLLAFGAALGSVVIRNRLEDRFTLPEPGELAHETAVSVHNAARAAVVAAIREADRPDAALLVEAVRQAVGEAAVAGADVTAVAIGAVEGAIEVAHLLDTRRSKVASLAADTAVDAAASQGIVAADRVRAALAPHASRPGPGR